MTHGLDGLGITVSTEFGMGEDSLWFPVSDILSIQKSHIWIPALLKPHKCIPGAQFFIFKWGVFPIITAFYLPVCSWGGDRRGIWDNLSTSRIIGFQFHLHSIVQHILPIFVYSIVWCTEREQKCRIVSQVSRCPHINFRLQSRRFCFSNSTERISTKK